MFRWLKSGLSRAGLFEGEVSLLSLFIARNSFTSPGSSRELLDIWSKLSEESWGLPEGVCNFFFFFCIFLIFLVCWGDQFQTRIIFIICFLFFESLSSFFCSPDWNAGDDGPWIPLRCSLPVCVV